MHEHARNVYSALGMFEKADDGWSGLSHKIHAGKGWFCWKEAPFYLEFDGGGTKGTRARYEKWVFQSYSFVEDVVGRGMPSISVDESQIISKTEISEEEYRAITGV